MNELEKLRDLLDAENIPYVNDTDNILNIDRVKYPDKNFVCSVIYGKGSIGYEAGKLEIMGLAIPEQDIVEGYLTANEVFTRIFNHYVANSVRSNK